MHEDELIKKYVKPTSSRAVVLGQGDDCSVIDYDSDHFLIATTDSLVEHTHFRRSDISFMQLGYKSLAVNISDISAMGGTPQWAHLSLAFPDDTKESHIKEFFSGFYSLADSIDVKLVGGDMCVSRSDFFINIHLSGLVLKSQIQHRSDFPKADILCVSGPLGDSAAGLECLLRNRAKNEWDELITRHLTPPIENKKAQWLAKQVGIHGMMDVSDGLMTDLQRIPNVGFHIELEKLPHSQTLLAYCRQNQNDIYQYSLAGGEDYVLLFGCTEKNLESHLFQYKKQFGESFYPIGKINRNNRGVRYFRKNQEQKLNYQTFSHFKD